MMRRRAQSAFSLLELMFSFVILLLVALYLMSIFAQGQRHWLRAQEYSTACWLVNSKLQDLMATPFHELPAATGNQLYAFDAPFADYLYSLKTDPYEEDLFTLSVEVHSRKGAVARASTLTADNLRFQGVATDAGTHKVVFVPGATPNNSASLGYYDDLTGTTDLANPASPSGQPVGAVAGWPGGNYVWAASPLTGLLPYTESLPTPKTWGANLVSPLPGGPSAGQTAPRYAGIAVDASGSRVFAADPSNRCVWYLRATGTPSWSTTPLVARKPPLGSPTGIGTDEFGGLVWVADQEYQCLRKFTFVAPTGVPAAQLEAVGSLGYWDRTRYQPPASVGRLGAIQGVAVEPQGWAVYVCDHSSLYRLIDSKPVASQWTRVADFTSEMRAAGPCGLALDPFSNVFFVNCRNGKLFRVRPGGSPVVQKVWP